MKSQETIVIIPAKGNSGRLPGKNLRALKGKPLFLHSLNFAKAHPNIVDRIIVSTDDNEIKKIALANGAEVIDRPAHLCLDTSTTLSAIEHVLESIKGKVENIILLQPTNPLRPANLLTEAYEVFRKEELESLMTVTRSYQKLGRLVGDKYIPYNYKIGQRSQDLEPLFFENGLLYISKANLIKKGSLLGEKNFAFKVDHPFAGVDIDSYEDFQYAEFIMKKEKY